MDKSNPMLLGQTQNKTLPHLNQKPQNCEGVEDVQGVLTLFCCGAAQVVCHALRVVELREQLEVEEEDGDRQEEEVEVESGRNESKRCAHEYDRG